MKTLSNCSKNTYSTTSHSNPHTHTVRKKYIQMQTSCLVRFCLDAICLPGFAARIVIPALKDTKSYDPGTQKKGAHIQKLHLKTVTCRGHPFCLK